MFTHKCGPLTIDVLSQLAGLLWMTDGAVCFYFCCTILNLFVYFQVLPAEGQRVYHADGGLGVRVYVRVPGQRTEAGPHPAHRQVLPYSHTRYSIALYNCILFNYR